MWLLEKILIAYVDHTIFLLDRAVLAYVRNSYILEFKKKAGEKKWKSKRKMGTRCEQAIYKRKLWLKCM